MATRSNVFYPSNIFAQPTEPNHLFYGVYVHCDGYPKGVGAVLKEHYSTLPKMRALVEAKSISSLTDTPDEFKCHEDAEIMTYNVANITELHHALFHKKELGWDIEYVYIWDGAKYIAYTSQGVIVPNF